MKTGIFKVGIITYKGTILSIYPNDDTTLTNEIKPIISKLDVTNPISVIEKKDFLFTSLTDRNSISYIIISDKEVDSNHCGSFLTSLKQKWLTKYGIESTNFIEFQKNQEFGEIISELLIKENQGRISINNQNQNEKIDGPIIESNEINIEENDQVKLPLTFPSDHYSESVTQLKIKICWQKYKCLFLTLLILIIIIILLIIIYCPDLNLLKCYKKFFK